MIEIGGQLQIVGVTSASLGCQGGTCDPCSNGSKHTRVDRFADWIASIVGDSFVPCDDDIERLRQAVNRHCPVLDNLRKPLKVELDLKRRGQG